MTNRGLRWSTPVMLVAALWVAAGCGEVDDTENRPEWWGYYATEVVTFEPGEGAGYNADRISEVVPGPPDAGGGPESGSLEVVSLGDGGEIVVGFGETEIVDGDGDDLVVYENPFRVAGDSEQVWAEAGEVSVSPDGDEWHTFECDATPDEEPPYEGCAGWTPTLNFDPDEQTPPDPERTGGDGFDLADVGVDRARYVRIRDLWGEGGEPSRGFDFDAVGVVHAE